MLRTISKKLIYLVYSNSTSDFDLWFSSVILAQEHPLHTSPPPSISLTYPPDLSPLIPEPVERMNVMPSVSITPASPSSVIGKAMRPNQLDLEGPIRPARQLKSSNLSVSCEFYSGFWSGW